MLHIITSRTIQSATIFGSSSSRCMIHAVTNSSTGINRSQSSSTSASVVGNGITTNEASVNKQQQQRCFMSTQPITSPVTEEVQMMLILGKPGGGKGTISGKILKDFPSIHHISSGDLLRAHVRERTTIGINAKNYMDHGQLVPDELMIELVMDDATPILEQGKILLLDGFPRTLDQAIALGSVTQVDTVINLDIPTEIIVSRIADRWIHPGSGRIYSYSYKAPIKEGYDDITGEPLIQRDDDKPESVRTRLDAYDAATSPLINYYNELGVLKTFTGTMSDIIYPQVKNWLQNEKNI